MIIDCHTHVNNYHDENSETLDESIQMLLRSMRRNRIDVALVLTSYKVTAGRPSTAAVVEATRPYPNLFVVAGITYAGFDPQHLETLKPGVAEGKIRGLKLYPGYEPFFPSDPALEPVYEFARENQLPVMIHTGDTYTPRGKLKYSHPLNVDELAVDHPEVHFVICHLGNPWIRDCMEVVYKNANVSTDLSGLVLGGFDDRFESYMRKQVHDMLSYGMQPEHILYGSDWPIATMESYLEFMEELRLPTKDRQLIMYENAARIFRLPLPSPRNGGLFGVL